MNPNRDDRILPFTRIVSALVVPILMLAFLALYVRSDHTDVEFAWTILPRSSAILIGAGYTAGVVFFVRLLMDRNWHHVQAGFLPIAAFTVCMIAATLLHWSRFHHGTFIFYLWTASYAVTPLLVPLVWWLNRSTDLRATHESPLRFSLTSRRLLGFVGAAGAVASLIAFAQPSMLIPLAPWELTPLTARVFAGWGMLALLTLFSIALDGRWSATRILLEAGLTAVILNVIALPRMWADFDPASPLTYVYVAALAAALIALPMIYLRFARAARRDK